MKLYRYFIIPVFVLSITSCKQKPEVSKPFEMGNLVRLENFHSEIVQSRNVDVWLPPGYDSARADAYPVIYMNDGQNLFIPELAYTGITWEVASTLTRLIEEKLIEPVIVVGIWNTNLRFQEYMPQDEAIAYPKPVLNKMKKERISPMGDYYTDFIVQELKPFIDEKFNTNPAREKTSIIGSSMGGLISLYALTRYPDVFGGAGCISTHWPLYGKNNSDMAAKPLIEYFKNHLPTQGSHKIYFDYGTETLDAWYEVHQLRMDSAMIELGYEKGGPYWTTLKFEGADHSEDSWRKRFDVVVKFLLN